jgi:shikimate kinase
MALRDKVLIAGFSGAGKTSLVRAVKSCAPEAWDHFDDLDRLILRNRGQGLSSVAELVETHGWDKFRLWERQELESWLKLEGAGVLALGGGTLSPLVWELLGAEKKLQFCYLKVPFEVCWERLSLPGIEERPLVGQGQSKLHELFVSREIVFEKISWELDGRLPLAELSRRFWDQLGSC